MKLLDLFSGIGGFAKGIEQAGIKIEEHYYSEIDKYAKAIYKRHWPEAIDLGAVESISGSDFEPFDLITFGFPCQDLSVAGRREGLSGSRSNLFFEATRVIRENRPNAFIFENVKGLFSSNGGKDFVRVLREIADIGLYECQWQLLNTSWFLPQNRERIFFVGCITEGCGQKIFPVGSTADNNIGGKELIELTDTGKPQDQRIYDSRGLATSLLSSGAKGSYLTPQLDVANTLTPDAYLTSGQRKRINGKSVLTSMHERRIRRLTPIECERLQGFPDDWTKYGADGEKVSDTQRYRCLGNAVTTNVVQAIMEKWK